MDDVIPELWTVPSTASVRKYNVKIEELYLEVDHVHAAAAHHHPVGDDRPPDLNILHHEPLEVVQDQFLGRICKQNVTKMSKYLQHHTAQLTLATIEGVCVRVNSEVKVFVPTENGSIGIPYQKNSSSIVI